MPFKIILCLLLAVMTAHAGITPSGSDRWKGFERVHYTIGRHNAYVVKPQKAEAGNPWIWRASFPDWHTDIDSLLLTRGFHVAYVSVDNQYGSPYAMQVWDQWYSFLTGQLHLARKVTLEGISRGGLYVFGWAKRNPDKVNLIYGEGPVCDIKSWPGGRGKGKGDPKSWQQLLEVYSMTEAQAMAFNDNPVDNLEGLASWKVPVIHAVGLKDEHVPADENSLIFAERYTALGGPVVVYPMTRGTQALEGHHYAIEAVKLWVDMIVSVSIPVKPVQDYSHWYQLREGLPGSRTRLQKDKSLNVAFLGGSITHNKGWREKVSRYLTERFPEAKFNFIPAGIPSLGSLPHAFRLQKDVLDKARVDLLFVEAAVNDRANATDSLTQLLSLEGIVRHARHSNPDMDIVLMSFADPDKNHDFDLGKIPAEIANHEHIADHYRLPSINLARTVYDKIQNGEFTWNEDFKDLHPSVFGQELYFNSIKSLLQTAFEDTTVTASRGLPPALHPHFLGNGTHLPVSRAVKLKGWSYISDWAPADKLPVRTGFVHVPAVETTSPGSTLQLEFEGTAIGLSLVSGPDAGLLTYSVDGGKFKDIDTFTQWSKQLHLPWFLLLESHLKKGRHVLTLKMSDRRNPASEGNASRILSFLVNP